MILNLVLCWRAAERQPSVHQSSFLVSLRSVRRTAALPLALFSPTIRSERCVRIEFATLVADTHLFRYVQQSGRLTRLDAAARFKFVIELADAAEKLAANCEQATTASATTIVVPTVVDRDAAVVRARSEFTIVAAKPVDTDSCFVLMGGFSTSKFRWVNSLLSRHFERNHAF